jgi:hypothetical protein
MKVAIQMLEGRETALIQDELVKVITARYGLAAAGRGGPSS